jgi:hypothetical protein
MTVVPFCRVWLSGKPRAPHRASAALWSRTRVRPLAFFLALSLSALCCSSALASAALISNGTDAAARAVAFAGFPETAITSVEQCKVSDPTNPFWEVQDLAVWEVVFDEITFAAPQPEGEPVPNPNLHTLTVWLDPETGAPLKIATPRPAEGGLRLMISPVTKRLSCSLLNFTFTKSPDPPDKALSATALAGRKQQRCTSVATEIVAYYGLLTYRGPETLIAEKPSWFIYYAGVREPVPSGGGVPLGVSSKPAAPRYASEAMLAIDATSGRLLFVHLAGAPD